MGDLPRLTPALLHRNLDRRTGDDAHRDQAIATGPDRTVDSTTPTSMLTGRLEKPCTEPW